ncbi:MAG: phosphoribosylamine--glycine ligase [Alphaproteobacteria bacterium]|nr:phosphoribosylamine--glycine ligase [Alphaproteobacteria bacterium]
MGASVSTDILVVGGGGREHTLAWRLARSPSAGRVFVAPGNGGVDADPRLERLDVRDVDIDGILHAAVDLQVGLVVVGPEAPLAEGLADRLAGVGIPCFGPTSAGARLEASKHFAKGFMDRHGIPTARWAAFSALEPALAWLDAVDFPVVVKASGLAAGKGVLIPDGPEETRAALRRVLVDRDFGDAGDEVVLEERLTGPEVSVLAFTDGQRYAMMPPAQDHKRALEGDLGPNTGGMGAYAPAPVATPALLRQIEAEVIAPTLRGLAAEGAPYRGVLYAGVMLTPDGPRVLEFNCRFGDPETQALVPLLDGDLAEIMLACATGALDPARVTWREGSAATVVLASQGYPGPYRKGFPITGVNQADALDGVEVFQAGTRFEGGQLVTSGGRVLAVTGRGATLREALQRAYAGARCIDFEGRTFRRDIGWRALTQEP